MTCERTREDFAALGDQSEGVTMAKASHGHSKISWFSDAGTGGRPENIEEILMALLTCNNSNEWFADKEELCEFLVGLGEGMQSDTAICGIVDYLLSAGFVRMGETRDGVPGVPICADRRIRQFLERIRRTSR